MMRIGVVVPTQAATVDTVADQLREVERLGFDSAWMPGIPNGPDVLTLLAIAGRATTRLELGPAIVAAPPRHPVALAQQALTVDDALGGRLTLGIGASHERIVAGLWGLPYDRPAQRMADYLSVLVPLLRHQRVDIAATHYRTRYTLDIRRGDADGPGVFLAALGPRMLDVAATHADGVATWMVGLRAVAEHTVPRALAAADAAGRSAPRVLVSLPYLLTDDTDAARARADEEFALYAKLPAYKAMFEIEGAGRPSDVAVFGDERTLAAAVARQRDAGVTDLQITPFGTPEQCARTVECMAAMR